MEHGGKDAGPGQNHCNGEGWLDGGSQHPGLRRVVSIDTCESFSGFQVYANDNEKPSMI